MTARTENVKTNGVAYCAIVCSKCNRTWMTELQQLSYDQGIIAHQTIYAAANKSGKTNAVAAASKLLVEPHLFTTVPGGGRIYLVAEPMAHGERMTLEWDHNGREYSLSYFIDNRLIASAVDPKEIYAAAVARLVQQMVKGQWNVSMP